MPTSVGPNTKGEENLVFGYDLGDVSNSYKGEPTVNLSYNNGQGGSEYLAAPITWINAGTWTYDGNATDVPKPTVPEINTDNLRVMSGLNTTAGGSVHFGCGYTPISPSTTYTVSVWYRQNRAGASQPYLRTNITNVGLANLAYNGNTDSGTWPVNEWIRVSATGTTAANENAIYISNYIGTYVGDKIWYFGHQVEQKSHSTPLVIGTRSATQGLKDLTGNSTIDLTNVSFDSNAQMAFDGTTDYVTVPHNAAHSFTGDFSIEIVFKPTGNTANCLIQKGSGNDYFQEYWVLCDTRGSNTSFELIMGQVGNTSANYNVRANNAVIGQYHHIVTGVQGSTGFMYVNGELIDTGAVTDRIQSTSDIRIGERVDGFADSLGDQPLTKIYNRALTASEIKSNFNAIKGRFNI